MPGLTLPRRRRASRSLLRWSALPLSSGAGGTSQGPERTSQDLRESSSSAPRGKAVEPSEPIPFGGRSKDRRDYSPRLVTALDQIHDQGIELFLAGATERPYCSLELLLRDAKRRAGQDASSSSESMRPCSGRPRKDALPVWLLDLLLL